MKNEISIKSIISLILLIILIIIGSITLVKSINNIEPGMKGVVLYKLTDGLDTEHVYSEGLVLIAPWNELIVYDVRQKNIDMSLSVLDKNGLEVGIDVSVVYRPIENSIGNLHLKTGRNYESIVVIPRTRSAGREITGKFDAEELYSSKRDMLQTGIEDILRDKFSENFLKVEDVLIRDVNLPRVIKQAIENKQAQEQKNEFAKKLESEAKSKANARRATSQGKKDADILEAEGTAQAIKLIQDQLKSSPQYIEMLKIQGYAEHGKSWYGNNNMFGVNSVSVIKGLK